MKYLIAVVTTLIAVNSLTAHAVRENGGRRAPMAVKIQFSSLGNGINRELKERVTALIQEYRMGRNVTRYSEKYWGMEGEITLCVQFSTFNLAYEFNNDVNKLIGENNRNTMAQRALSCDEEDIIRPNE